VNRKHTFLLDVFRNDMDEEDYLEMKEDTLEQVINVRIYPDTHYQ
jgi:hypothetical protein